MFIYFRVLVDFVLYSTCFICMSDFKLVKSSQGMLFPRLKCPLPSSFGTMGDQTMDLRSLYRYSKYWKLTHTYATVSTV